MADLGWHVGGGRSKVIDNYLTGSGKFFVANVRLPLGDIG
jgi:hypothetical protein